MEGLFYFKVKFRIDLPDRRLFRVVILLQNVASRHVSKICKA